jgi:hypothetical protein
MVAENVASPPGERVTAAGVIVTDIAGVTVTVAVALDSGSAVLVAVT